MPRPTRRAGPGLGSRGLRGWQSTPFTGSQGTRGADPRPWALQTARQEGWEVLPYLASVSPVAFLLTLAAGTSIQGKGSLAKEEDWLLWEDQ